MLWGMVGLLTAVGTAMSAFAALAHGGLIWVTIAVAAAAMGLAAYMALLSSSALPPIPPTLHKKNSSVISPINPSSVTSGI